MPTDEETLLSILDQPDLTEVPDGLEAVQSVEAVNKLDELQRATLQALLEGDLPTPEEIQRDAKIAEHNSEIQRKRDERLAKRREKQARSNKKRRRRR
jgi:hypothetical protein